MSRKCGILLVLPAVVLFFILYPPVPSAAALAPREIAVVVNSRSPDSLRIGESYIRLRNVPSGHLIRINVAPEEEVSRRDYDALIAAPVREAVNRLLDKGEDIRCIVTTYGVPLRISAVRPLIIPEEEIQGYRSIKRQKQERLAALRTMRRESKKSGKDLRAELLKEMKKLRKEIERLNLKIGRLRGADTVAAVDSELAMVLVPDYPLEGWQPNPAYIRNRARGITYYGKVLMASRLDAPTPDLALGLARTAVEVEKTGLSGRIYLDARGLKGKDAYALFDQDIRRAARILRQGPLPVILDNRPKLLEHAPSAALYCGWYRLGRYADVFQWRKGAVGYHVASIEARSLHDPGGRYWVKGMIERGVTATLGPVAEPYLSAFPLPSLFFPLLMSGRYTLAEVFSLSNPYLSWRMILIGDPLYNPFRNRPAYFMKNPPPPP
ncbi:MAG: TIGR03790 family protein [Deferribacteres bacterium]|nr:TIGR03790 family protein [Deferribacteres bacterium]